MTKTVLIASNNHDCDTLSKYIQARGFFCQCIDLDERLLTHANRWRPQAIISELSFRSRFFAPSDPESVFTLLLAVRCRLHGVPVVTLSRTPSPELETRSRQLGMAGHFTLPFDMKEIYSVLQSSIRSVAHRAHAAGSPLAGLNSGEPRRRGRPRKYPLFPLSPAPFNAENTPAFPQTFVPEIATSPAPTFVLPTPIPEPLLAEAITV